MKTLILIAITLISISQLFAQSNFRFADTTAQWNALYSQYGWIGGQFKHTDIYTVRGDTTIAGKQYQIIRPTPSVYDGIFVRVDSLQQVFCVTEHDATENKIYDFSKNAGDTFAIVNALAIVDSVDSVTWLGKTRKRMYVRPEGGTNPYFNDIWVEGVGALLSPIYMPFYGWNGADFPEIKLLCYFENGQRAYHNASLGDSCIISVGTGIEESIKQEVKVYPNPANGHQITIEAENSAGRHFILCDALGREVKREILTQPMQPISITGLMAGLYYYSISNEKQKVIAGKLIVVKD